MTCPEAGRTAGQLALVEVSLERLPRGRHKLSREEVQQSQRLRMVLAIADAMSEKGYVGTSVADVLKRAGVSRETFYQQFSSKLDCFMSAFDAASEMLLARVEQTVQELDGSPIERFERAFAAYIQSLIEHPALARVFLVEVYAAGPDALDQRLARQGLIVDWVCDLLEASGREDRFACEMLVAAVGAKVTRPVMAQDAEALRALQVEVVELVRRFLGERPASAN